MEKQLYMDFNGVFGSTMRRKEDKSVFWELTYECWFNYWHYKKSTKCGELKLSLGLMTSWGGKTMLWRLYECGESIDSKTERIRPNKCHLCHFEPIYISLGLTPLLCIPQYIQSIYRANPMYLQSSWTKLYLNGP